MLSLSEQPLAEGPSSPEQHRDERSALPRLDATLAWLSWPWSDLG